MLTLALICETKKKPLGHVCAFGIPGVYPFVIV